MTNSFPPDPNRQRETNDERIAVFIALAAIGTILFWGITRGDDRLNLARLNPLADADIEADLGADLGIGDEQLSNLDDSAADDAVIDRPDPGAIAEPLSRLFAFNASPSDDREETPQEIRGLREGRDDARLVPSPSGQTSPDAGLQQTEGAAEPSEPTPSDEINTEADSETSSPDETAVQEENLPPAVDFPDIAEDYWAKPFIDRLSQQGIIGGFDDGSFQPDSLLTRAQFAANIKQAFGNGSRTSGVNNYTDVGPEYWAAESIQAATETGFMSGYPEQDFRPENPVTRLEAIVALVTGLNLSIPDNPEEALQVYGDRSDVPDWAVEKLAAATRAGIVILYPDPEELNPDAPITRAETSALIYQALASQEKVPDIPSEYRVKPD